MNSKTPFYMFIVSVVVAVGMLVFAVNRSGSKAGELLGAQQAQDIAALQQSIFDLQQTVKKQSRVIEQLSNGTVTVDEGDTTEPLGLLLCRGRRALGGDGTICRAAHGGS